MQRPSMTANLPPATPATDEPPVFTRVVLFTDTDGRARFREEPLVLSEGRLL